MMNTKRALEKIELYRSMGYTGFRVFFGTLQGTDTQGFRRDLGKIASAAQTKIQKILLG